MILPRTFYEITFLILQIEIGILRYYTTHIIYITVSEFEKGGAVLHSPIPQMPLYITGKIIIYMYRSYLVSLLWEPCLVLLSKVS